MLFDTLACLWSELALEDSTGSIFSFLQYSFFSDFVFKIRLIRLGFSFQKQKKILNLNSQPTDSQSGVITTEPTVSV